ncbi:MAG: GNAT family N-acetyltransferase [Anaerolineales bacterium]|nr:GNAT family N-acetyltransferase [Anaerolineales bacterium]
MSEITFRTAKREDLSTIVRMLAEDDLGSQREQYDEPLPEAYYKAFEQIENDSNHELIVAELDGEVVGTLHLIFIPSISFQGGLRAQVESVRVGRVFRNRGIGREMLKWAIERAQRRDAHLIQLTTHRSRKDAHRFYEKLGFEGSHLGMKLMLK